MSRTVTVLAIDGGGVRGIIPAMVLHNLMRRVTLMAQMRRRRGLFLRERAWRRAAIQHVGETGARPAVRSLFDMMAGTSTGALVVLACSMPQPLSTQRIVELYRHEAEVIFPRSRYAAMRTMQTMRQAFAGKFDPAPYEDFLRRHFGELRLHDCPANLLIPAYDTDNRTPHFFKRRHESAPKPGYPTRADKRDFLLRDVARATSAAPTYFPPARITACDGQGFTLVDGGIVANNPTLSAVVEARKLYPDARRIVVVSLGTGRSGRRFPYEQIKSWGYLEWVSPLQGSPLTAMIMDGQSEATAHHLTNLRGLDYYRFNIDLGEVGEELDDSDPRHLEALAQLAKRLIAGHSQALHRVAVLLAKRIS